MTKRKMTEQTLIYKKLHRKLNIEKHGNLKKYKETMNEVDNHSMLHCRLKAVEEILDEFFFHRHYLLNVCIFFSLTNILYHCWRCVSQHDMEPVQFLFSARIFLKNPEILRGTHVYVFIIINNVQRHFLCSVVVR